MTGCLVAFVPGCYQITSFENPAENRDAVVQRETQFLVTKKVEATEIV